MVLAMVVVQVLPEEENGVALEVAGGVGADTSDGPLHNDSYIHFPVWLPHVFFFFNCLGTPVYILASKRLMKTMPPLWVRTCVLTATHCPHSVSTIDA